MLEYICIILEHLHRSLRSRIHPFTLFWWRDSLRFLSDSISWCPVPKMLFWWCNGFWIRFGFSSLVIMSFERSGVSEDIALPPTSLVGVGLRDRCGLGVLLYSYLLYYFTQTYYIIILKFIILIYSNLLYYYTQMYYNIVLNFRGLKSDL